MRQNNSEKEKWRKFLGWLFIGFLLLSYDGPSCGNDVLCPPNEQTKSPKKKPLMHPAERKGCSCSGCALSSKTDRKHASLASKKKSHRSQSGCFRSTKEKKHNPPRQNGCGACSSCSPPRPSSGCGDSSSSPRTASTAPSQFPITSQNSSPVRFSWFHTPPLLHRPKMRRSIQIAEAPCSVKISSFLLPDTSISANFSNNPAWNQNQVPVPGILHQQHSPFARFLPKIHKNSDTKLPKGWISPQEEQFDDAVLPNTRDRTKERFRFLRQQMVELARAYLRNNSKITPNVIREHGDLQHPLFPLPILLERLNQVEPKVKTLDDWITRLMTKSQRQEAMGATPKGFKSKRFGFPKSAGEKSAASMHINCLQRCQKHPMLLNAENDERTGVCKYLCQPCDCIDEPVKMTPSQRILFQGLRIAEAYAKFELCKLPGMGKTRYCKTSGPLAMYIKNPKYKWLQEESLGITALRDMVLWVGQLKP